LIFLNYSEKLKFIITNEKKINLKRWIGSSAILQCLVVFVLVMLHLNFSTTPLFPKKTIDQNNLIKSVSVKQTSAIVANSNQPVKWTILVRRSEIKENQNLIQLPKSAQNIKTKTITKEEAQTILSKKTPASQEQLSLKDRKKNVSLASKNIFTKISKFFFADLEQAVVDIVEEVVEQFTEEVVTTDEASFVDVSEYIVEEIATPSSDDSARNDEIEIIDPIETPSEIVAPSDNYQTPSSVIPSLTGNPDTTDAGNNLDSPLQGNDAPILETVSPSDSSVITSEEITTPSSDDSARNDESVLEETVSPSDQPVLEETEMMEEIDKEYVKIDYETPAPTITEQEIKDGKIITVSVPDEVVIESLVEEVPTIPIYKNVLAFTTIPEIYKVGQESKIKIKWQNPDCEAIEDTQQAEACRDNGTMAFHAYDLNENGKLDYVEWVVPHLSEQIFEVIFISKAWQLDSNREIIDDVYDAVAIQEGTYTENTFATIPANDYIRVTFKAILASNNDITIYASPAEAVGEGGIAPSIEVYPVYTDAEGNQTEGQQLYLVDDGVNPNFSNIDHDGKYRILLSNLSQSTDVFDLKVISGDIDFDYIVDPGTTLYWVGDDGANTATASNWKTTDPAGCGSGDSASAPTNADILVFDADCDNGAKFNASLTASTGSITVQGGYTGTITGGSGITYANPVTLSDNVIISVPTGTFTLSGIIGDGGAAKGISKTGAGTLSLSGANTFTGGLTIKEGRCDLKTSTSAGGGSGTGTITLGDSSANANDVWLTGDGRTWANPIVLASGTTGVIKISPTASCTFSGGITGTNNLSTNCTAIYKLTFSTATVDFTGTITNIGAGSGTVTISSVIGTNVTGVIQNSATSQLTLSGANTFTGGLIIKAGTVYGTTSRKAFGGNGSGAITIGDTSGSANAILYIGNAGISNPITVASGSSGILELKTGSYANTMDSHITLANNLTITNAGTVDGMSYGLFRGGIDGTGNIIINNTSVSYATFSTVTINNTGTITNSGAGTGATTISAVIGTNVTGVIQNSATSQLTLSGANTFTGGLTIKAGTVSLATSTSAGGSHAVNGAGKGIITLGDSSANSSAVTLMGDGRTFANPIVFADIANATGTMTIMPSATSCVFSGGVTGTNNLTLNGSSTFTLTLSTGDINNIGTIINLNTGTGAVTISSVIGTNVTGITQNTATSTMTLSGNNSTVGSVTISAGVLALSGSTNLNVSGGWTNSVGAGGFTANTSTVTLLAGTHAITGANTFYNLTLNANNTVTFPASVTQTIGGAFVATGTAGNVITIDSSSTGTQATLSAATGTFNCDYLSLKDSDATGGADWHAGANSAAVSNVTGWLDLETNSLPVASSVSIDAGAGSVTLIGGTTKNVVCAGTVTDANGYADITSVTAKLYRSAVTAEGDDDNANHYTLTGDANCVPSGGSENTETYTCTFPVYFYAEPTDAGSTYEAQNWVCEMTPTDTVGAGTADDDTIEMATLQSISVSETIDFGSVNPGAESSGNHITTVTNNGNVAVDYKVSGGGLNCSTRGTISVASQEYGLSSFSYGDGAVLSESATDVNADLPKPSSGTPVTDDAYWQVAVPAGSEGTCTGTTTFVVRAAL